MQFVKFRFLGIPRVEVDGVVTSHFRWSKLPAFFAYLALHPGEQSREAIAEALWPDRAPESARQNLRQTLLYADKLLSPRTDQVMQVTRGSIALRPSAATSDIEAFFRRPSLTQDRSPRARYLQVVESYRGPFLPSMDEPWIASARAQIARIYFESLVFLARDFLQTDPARSLLLAERAVVEEPFDDSARAVKLAALLALGREAAAHQEYAAYADLLRDQLGMQPGKLVASALQEVRADSQKTERPPEPIDATAEAIAEALRFLSDQGMHREAANLAVALVPLWIGKGTPALGQELLVRTFRELEHPAGAYERLSLAKLALAEGDVVKTRGICEEILAGAPPAEVLAETELLLARVDLREVKPVSALQHALASLRIVRRLGNRTLESDAWICVVMARFAASQFERVLFSCRHVERLAEFLRDASTRQEMRLYRAYALLRLGRRDEAEAEAWAVRELLGAVETTRSYRFKGTLGRLFEDLGRLEDAGTIYAEALEECRAKGNEFGLNVVLTYLGDLELELGKPDDSLQYHFLALKSRRELKQNLGIATSLRGVGRALLAKGQPNEAKLSLQESAQRFRDDNAVSGHAGAQLLWAQAEFESGDRLLAGRLARHAVEILRGLSPAGRLTIGPWGSRILEEGEELVKRIGSR